MARNIIIDSIVSRYPSLLDDLVCKIGKLESERRNPWEAFWVAISASTSKFWEYCAIPKYKKCDCETGLPAFLHDRDPKHYRSSIGATITLEQNLFSSMTFDQSVDWLGLKLQAFYAEQYLDGNKLSGKMEDIKKLIYNVFNSSLSDAYVTIKNASASAYLYGTSVTYLASNSNVSLGLSNSNLVKFSEVPLTSFVWEEDEFGEIWFAARKFKATPAKMSEIPSIGADALMDGGSNLNVNRSSPLVFDKMNNTVQEYVHVIYKTPVEYRTVEQGVGAAAAEYIESMEYVEHIIDLRTRKIIGSGILLQMPYVVWFMSKECSEKYGKSRFFNIIDALKLLSDGPSLLMKKANLEINPPIMRHTSLETQQLIIEPDSRIDNALTEDGRPKLIPFHTGGASAFAQYLPQMIQEARLEIMQTSPVRNVLAETGQTGRTPTEVMEIRLTQDNIIKQYVIMAEQYMRKVVKYIIRDLINIGVLDINDLFREQMSGQVLTPKQQIDLFVDALDISYNGLLGKQLERWKDQSINDFFAQGVGVCQALGTQPGLVFNTQRILAKKAGYERIEGDIFNTGEEQQQMIQAAKEAQQQANEQAQFQEIKKALGG